MTTSSITRRISQFPLAQVSIIILIVTHFVGVLGFLSSWRDLFLTLTPVHLLITFILTIVNHGKIKAIFLLFTCCVMTASFLVEYLGVNTGVIFGEYTYGYALGPRIGNTPILIGVLWFTLVYSIGTIINGWSSSVIFKSCIGATFMVLIDLFIEPAATDLGFWTWHEDIIPAQNYLAWFIISFIFFIVMFRFSIAQKNPIAGTLYFTQLLFFAAISLFI